MLEGRDPSPGRPGVTIFLHIPKTGGTSVRNVVEGIYGPRCLPVYSLDAVTLATVKAGLGQADAVYGHLFYGVHEILGIQPRYVTIVRDPIERVISFYRHQARERDSDYFNAIAGGMTLLDLLEDGGCHQVNNHMVRIVSGHESTDPVYDEHVLDKAFANLDQFECLGVAERMDESIALFAHRLGWNTVPGVPRLNESLGPAFRIDSATREAIVSHNSLDLTFYAAVASAFKGCFAQLS